MHFLTSIGECNSRFREFLEENERGEDPIDSDLDLPLEFVEVSSILQARLLSPTTRSALGIVESTQGNGCEAWCLLSQTYDPMTDARFASLVISVVGFKVAKNVDIQAALVQWEGQVLRLEKDHKGKLSEELRERSS